MSDTAFLPPAFGWVNSPADVAAAVTRISAFQGVPALLSQAAPDLLAADDDRTVLFWTAEEKVLGRVLPSWNQGSVGSCFPAGTRVRMADGTHKPIEAVRLNDAVLTAEGNTGRVRHLFVRHEGECLYRFRCRGHYGLAATSEHPVLTKRGYVKMEDLRIGDLVAVPKYLPQSVGFVQTADHRSWQTRLRSDVSIGRTINYNGAAQFGRRAAVVQVAPMPDTIELTPGFGRIIGLFLAEGCTDKNKVVWTFSEAERDTLAAELIDLLRSELGAEAHVQKRGKKNTCKVNLHGRVWSELFESLCGNGSGMKRLHADVASGPVAFLRAVYEGWLAGDGHRRDNHVQGTTVSHDLALSMYDIATALGLMPVIRHCDPKPSHNVKTRRRRYDVVVGEGGGANRPPQDDKHVWRAVNSLIAEPYSGDVFNMEVEGDNSYVAEGIGVHNCVSFGFGRGCQDLMLIEIAAGEPEEWPGAEVATEPIYGGSRVEVGGGRIGGDGSVGAWAAEWVTKWGVLLRQKYGTIDLSSYSESRSRQWGDRGCPDELEPLAREHPVRSAAMVTSAQEAWAALGSGYPIPPCSDQGFTSTLKDGICEASGNWNHCMEFRGRFVHHTGERVFPTQNSWGGYLRGERTTKDIHGNVITLPEGCFLARWDVVDRMLRQRDSFALSGFKGFPKRNLDWLI